MNCWIAFAGRRATPTAASVKEFLSDVQKWYVSAGVVRSEAPLDQVLDTRYVDEANRKLGPFKLENAASTKAGCGSSHGSSTPMVSC